MKWIYHLIFIFISHTSIQAMQQEDYMNVNATLDSVQQFAAYFSNKDAEAIGSLITNDFKLFDPALKWVNGKEAFVDILKKQFAQVDRVKYEIINTFDDNSVKIVEFVITFGDLLLKGVDFIEFQDGKMKELRCYYNQPTAACETLKPFSSQAKSLVVGSLYQHYSGKKYKLISVARNSETLEEVVVYQAQYGEQDVWSRPLKMFIEDVVYQGQTVPRFKRIS